MNKEFSNAQQCVINGQVAQPKKKELLEVSNEEFVSAIFGPVIAGSSPVTCSKLGDPTQGGWLAVSTQTPKWQVPAVGNNYINCSTFVINDDLPIRAKRETFSACYFVLLDDIGTKVQLDQLHGFELTWMIESSPGNYQGGIAFDRPIVDAAEADALLSSLIEAGLCDAGASGALTRWARLPVGVNGKSKYLGSEGQPFQCRLVSWNPSARYSVKEIRARLSLAEQHVQMRSNRVAGDGQFSGASAVSLKAILDFLDPDMAYGDWIKVLMAVYHETDGSEIGFDLIDQWSSGSEKYPGYAAMLHKWKSFSDVSRPLTAGTLAYMVKQAGGNVEEILGNLGEGFKRCETEVIFANEDLSSVRNTKIRNALDAFSLRGQSDKLAASLHEERYVLGRVALTGQATVFYAASNTGKTLLTLHLLCDNIKKGEIDPSKVYYVNADDTAQGLVTKLRIAEEFGFEMLAPDHNEFKCDRLLKILAEMVQTNTANGVILVLDTLKKFTDLMHKKECSRFTAFVRAFVAHGGTVIGLAHVNKKRDENGRGTHAGTTDIIDDFDCAYMIDVVMKDPESGSKTIEFTNKKQRGNVVDCVAYNFTEAEGDDYLDRFLSVREVDPFAVITLKRSCEQKSDVAMIEIVSACIRDGFCSKMKLAAEVVRRTSVSNRAALNVIEKYTGSDCDHHRWHVVRGERGAHLYSLING